VRKKDVKLQAFKVHLGCKYQDHWFGVLIMSILDKTLNTNHWNITPKKPNLSGRVKSALDRAAAMTAGKPLRFDSIIRNRVL